MDYKVIKENVRVAFKRENVLLGLSVLTFICLVVLIFSLFRIFKKDDALQSERAAIKQERLVIEKERVAIQNERTGWEAVKQGYRDELTMERTNDSLRLIELEKTRQLLTDINKRYEKIPALINSYNSSQLKRAYAEFQP